MFGINIKLISDVYLIFIATFTKPFGGWVERDPQPNDLKDPHPGQKVYISASHTPG